MRRLAAEPQRLGEEVEIGPLLRFLESLVRVIDEANGQTAAPVDEDTFTLS